MIGTIITGEMIATTVMQMVIASIIGGFFLQVAFSIHSSMIGYKKPERKKTKPSKQKVDDTSDKKPPSPPPRTRNTTASKRDNSADRPEEISFSKAIGAVLLALIIYKGCSLLIGLTVYTLFPHSPEDDHRIIQLVIFLLSLGISFLSVSGIFKRVGNIPKYRSAMLITLLWIPLLGIAFVAVSMYIPGGV